MANNAEVKIIFTCTKFLHVQNVSRRSDIDSNCQNLILQILSNLQPSDTIKLF